MSFAQASRLYVLSAAVLFSTGGAAIKLCSLSSWQIAGFRSAIAAAVLWLLEPAWRRWAEPRALAVAVPYAVTLVLFVTANTLTTAANAIFLQTTAPLYLLALGPWLLGERTKPRDLAVVAVLAIGVGLLLAGREPPLRTAPDPTRGNLLAAASGLTWALTLIGLRRLARGVAGEGADPSGAAVVAGNALAFLLCLPLSVPVVESRAVDWMTIGYLGTVQIGLAYLCMIRGLRGLRAIEASLLLVLEPVLNAVWAWLVHGERPGARSLAGCAVILAGLLAQAVRREQ
jgi:drug/metabolite transporter (DMT)-like permease